MRILVVCGAGASSTFVAQRVRRAAEAEGLDLSASAGTEGMLPEAAGEHDLLLLGPQLAARAAQIRRRAASSGAAVVVLPESVVADLDGTATLDLIRRELARDRPATDRPAADGAGHPDQEESP